MPERFVLIMCKHYFSVTFAPSQVRRKYTTLFSGLATPPQPALSPRQRLPALERRTHEKARAYARAFSKTNPVRNIS